MVWLPAHLIPIREFENPDGRQRAVIFRRPDGKYGFSSESLEVIDGCLVWSPSGASGIYENLAAVQRGAVAAAVAS